MKFIVENSLTKETLHITAYDWEDAEYIVAAANEELSPYEAWKFVLLGEFVESGETPSQRTDH